ncbi:hypothetical protein MACJ_001785 [Theileria orientalis]|uniref:Uncharacterized protein n=1 Tax=Theileria orientalis TaxID=68886 RepID=A0A976M4Y8_THEOR|nr:hypothetical protein MACJ_001785 [Theileria orientalis]
METQELSSDETVQSLKPSNEIHEIKSSFLQDARVIVEIGKEVPNAAGNIAKQIQSESGTHKFRIKEAVDDEAWKIYDEGVGPDNRTKRIDKIHKLALRMGFKIMETLYPTNYEISESAYIDDDELEGLGGLTFIAVNGSDEEDENDADSPEDNAEAGSELGTVLEDEDDLMKLISSDFKCLTDAIDKNKDGIGKIINSTECTDKFKLADNIKDHVHDIARMITKIPEISKAIDTLPECTNISPGIMRATFEYILIIYATFISKPKHSEPLKDFVNYINDLFLDLNTVNRTIGKAMFGLVIAEIIKDNADEIAGRSKYGPSADSIRKNVETSIIRGGLMQGDKRRLFLLKALADSISHNIVRSMVDSKVLPESISNVVSEKMKAIIVDKVDDISGYYSSVVNAESIVKNVLSNVEHITSKIDQIFYDLNKSILIELQQLPTSPTGSSTQYELKLVKNDRQDPSQPESPGSGGNISLSSVTCLPSSNYICVTHKINLGSVIEEKDIGGVRLYFRGKEVETFDTNGRDKKSVLYQQGKNEVSVYFHARAVNVRGGSSTNNLRVNRAPLLFGYNSNFYKPLDRDNYVHKWVYVNTIISGGDGQTRQLTKELDDVNKSLNRIDLDQIATMWDSTQPVDGVSNNCYRKLYGIPHPGKDPPDNRLDKSFYDRVCVWGCVTENYRKQTHVTINKYGIGDVYLHGHRVTGINDTQPEHSQVSVYYDHCDHHFSRPLLILLSSQPGQEGEGPSPTQTKTWYKLGDLDGTKWDLERDSSSHESGDDDGQLKEKLTEIASGLYATLTIELHERKKYQKNVFIKANDQSVNSELEVVQKCSPAKLFLQCYHCCEHNLSEYYKAITTAPSQRSSEGQDQAAQARQQISVELKFVLDVAISGIKVGLFTTDNKVAPLLTYGQVDAASNTNFYVYFCKGDVADWTDANSGYPVPLMFNYNGKFYGPLSKVRYFGHWRELNISSPVSSSGTQLKSELDRIYHMLNGIDLTQTKTYGLNCSSEHPYYYKPGGLSTKRVIVTKYTNGTHTMYVHQTVHRTNIGDITHGNSEYKFNSHTSYITTKTINEVAVIFNGSSSTDIPLLVLLNQDGPGVGDGGDASADSIKQSTTHGYYYKKTERGDQPTVYTYHNIESGCILISKLMEQGSDGDDCLSEHTQPINDTWSQITRSPMTKDDTSGESEQEIPDCKGPCESQWKEGKCVGVHQQEIPDDADLVEVQGDNAKSILPCSPSSDCETCSEELDGSDSIASNASTEVRRSKRSKRSHRGSTGVEVPNGELGASGGHWSSSNGQPILSRLVGRDESEIRNKQLDLYCKFIVAFVSTASYLIFHMLDITSRHFADTASTKLEVVIAMVKMKV